MFKERVVYDFDKEICKPGAIIQFSTLTREIEYDTDSEDDKVIITPEWIMSEPQSVIITEYAPRALKVHGEKYMLLSMDVVVNNLNPSVLHRIRKGLPVYFIHAISQSLLQEPIVYKLDVEEIEKELDEE